MVIKTIGHSNKKIEEFVDKLKENKINTVIDVRSTPYSKWTTQFNRDNLSNLLPRYGFVYLFKGENLGGLKENIDFDKTIKEVVELSKTNNIALLCSEKDYRKCHRFLVLTPALERRHVDVGHITWDKDVSKTISLF